MVSTGAARGPTPAHSRDALARCAVGLADARGLHAVTMRAVAAELGTGAGALYRYVASRDDLLAIMVDAVMGAVPRRIEPDGGWRAAILGVAVTMLDVYRSHPWLVDVPPQAASPASVADYLEACLVALHDAPGEPAAKLEAAALVLGMVTLFARPPSGDADLSGRSDATRWPRLAAAAGETRDAAPRAGLFERAVIGAVEGIIGA
jgi:AcrR family transcriptional regulator